MWKNISEEDICSVCEPNKILENEKIKSAIHLKSAIHFKNEKISAT